MKPHPDNFCGGNFKDWLEVMLLPECNAHCSWCIEKNGFKPKTRLNWLDLAYKILETRKKNILLLGGEPTLYPDLKALIYFLDKYSRNVYLTTNGSKLTEKFAKDNLTLLTGINISIHNHDLLKNQDVTGIYLYERDLEQAIDLLRKHLVRVRFNCNLIKGHIDSYQKIQQYVNWARSYKADEVRFAELKMDYDNFVDIFRITNAAVGTQDPFTHGCCSKMTINGMEVHFRQMCGLQTNCRPKPKNPEQVLKQVLYYDGIIYNGWQIKTQQEKQETQETQENTMSTNTKKQKKPMSNDELLALLGDVKSGAMSAIDALVQIRLDQEFVALSNKPNQSNQSVSGDGCTY